MFCRTARLAFVLSTGLLAASDRAGAQSPGVAWRTDFEAARLEAAQTGRFVLLHFYTATCPPCRVLDNTVFNQPQVGAAIERDYVPVKVDAERQPAMRNWFQITSVPTDIVVSPDAQVVATLSPPSGAEAYVQQLENLARHYRPAAPGGPAGASAPVNSAYAGLPVGATANRYGQMSATPTETMTAGAASPAPPTSSPRAQVNPYMTGAPPAEAVAATPATAPEAAQTTTQPAAMPTSYRAPMFAGPPTGAQPTGGGGVDAPVAAEPAAVAAQSPAAAPAASAAPAVAAVAAPVVQSTIAPPAAATVAGAPPALPPNSPPVAFDGCCPVTLKSLNKWTPGNAAFGAIHRGRTYLFAGETQRQQFLADPDAFSPVFAGYDPVLLLDQQRSVPGERKFGYRYGGQFYLFASRETMAKFEASPQSYAAGVRQAMARLDGGIGGPVRR